MRRSLLTLGIGRIITSMHTILRLLRQRVDQKNCEQLIDVWLESLAVASAGDRRSVFYFPMHAFSEGVRPRRLSLTPDLLYSSHNSRPIPVLLAVNHATPLQQYSISLIWPTVSMACFLNF